VRTLSAEIARLAAEIADQDASEKRADRDFRDGRTIIGGFPRPRRENTLRVGRALKIAGRCCDAGLAYTSVGGELLQIEALRLPGKGRMKTTGKLGDCDEGIHDAPAEPASAVDQPKSG